MAPIVQGVKVRGSRMNTGPGLDNGFRICFRPAGVLKEFALHAAGLF